MLSSMYLAADIHVMRLSSVCPIKLQYRSLCILHAYRLRSTGCSDCIMLWRFKNCQRCY